MEGRMIVGAGDGTVELVKELTTATYPECSALCKIKMPSVPHLLVVSKIVFGTDM
jgi:hypothetical protein